MDCYKGSSRFYYQIIKKCIPGRNRVYMLLLSTCPQILSLDLYPFAVRPQGTEKTGQE